jgi:Arc/MetJ-type ribon-helix-helix transcriptional regulator
MNVVLPPELQKRVNESLDRGEFASTDQFFSEAAELLLEARRGSGSPIPVDEHWNERLEAAIDEGQASGEALELCDHDWQEIERQGLRLMRARRKA